MKEKPLLTETDKEIIKAIADNRLNLAAAARASFRGLTTVRTHVTKIRKETGLNPQDFWDLIKLLKMIGVIVDG